MIHLPQQIRDMMGEAIPREALVSGERLKTSFYLSSNQAQMMDVESAERLAALRLSINPVNYSYDELLERFERVGDGWHDRDEHKNGRNAGTKRTLEGKRTYNWEISSGGDPIGFCCAVKRGFNSDLQSMVENFDEAAGLKVGDGMEIYKVALYRAHTKQGIGRTVFPLIHDRIFKGQDAQTDHRGNEIPALKSSKFIFLSSTIGPKFADGTFEGNLVDTRPHYRRLGYTRVGENRFTIHAPFSNAISSTGVSEDLSNITNSSSNQPGISDGLSRKMA